MSNFNNLTDKNLYNVTKYNELEVLKTPLTDNEQKETNSFKEEYNLIFKQFLRNSAKMIGQTEEIFKNTPEQTQKTVRPKTAVQTQRTARPITTKQQTPNKEQINPLIPEQTKRTAGQKRLSFTTRTPLRPLTQT